MAVDGFNPSLATVEGASTTSLAVSDDGNLPAARNLDSAFGVSDRGVNEVMYTFVRSVGPPFSVPWTTRLP